MSQDTKRNQNEPVNETTSGAVKQDLEFLREIVHKGVLELQPTFDKSGVNYPDAEPFLKDKDAVAVKSMLERLTQKGTLKSKIVDRALICPHCGSPEIHSKFTCPRCKSESVALTQLIEHTKCGYIGPLSDFSNPNGLVCPRCKTTLTSEPLDYRIIGNFYQCENCENRFDKPEVKHVCQNCGKPSTSQDVKYEKVFSYRVSDAVVWELGHELPILENIRLFLADKGFTVKLQSEVEGASGVKSFFAIIAEKSNVRIVVDVSLEGDKKDLVALLAKKVDVNPTRALILDLSGGAELAGLGKIYGIDVVTAKADQNVPKEFEELLAKHV
jgi:hypothetical protein